MILKDSKISRDEINYQKISRDEINYHALYCACIKLLYI
jgi:hypothetical protein